MNATCPNCKASLAVPLSELTPKQRRAVKALASGKYDSKSEASKAAGISRATMARLSHNEKANNALVLEIAKQSDKARDTLADLSLVKKRAMERILAETEGEGLTFEQAGTLAKFAIDCIPLEMKLQEAKGGDNSAADDALTRMLLYTSTLTSRVARRFGAAAAAAASQAIVERSQQRMVRHG